MSPGHGPYVVARGCRPRRETRFEAGVRRAGFGLGGRAPRAGHAARRGRDRPAVAPRSGRASGPSAVASRRSGSSGSRCAAGGLDPPGDAGLTRPPGRRHWSVCHRTGSGGPRGHSDDLRRRSGSAQRRGTQADRDLTAARRSARSSAVSSTSHAVHKASSTAIAGTAGAMIANSVSTRASWPTGWAPRTPARPSRRRPPRPPAHPPARAAARADRLHRPDPHLRLDASRSAAHPPRRPATGTRLAAAARAGTPQPGCAARRAPSRACERARGRRAGSAGCAARSRPGRGAGPRDAADAHAGPARSAAADPKPRRTCTTTMPRPGNSAAIRGSTKPATTGGSLTRSSCTHDSSAASSERADGRALDAAAAGDERERRADDDRVLVGHRAVVVVADRQRGPQAARRRRVPAYRDHRELHLRVPRRDPLQGGQLRAAVLDGMEHEGQHERPALGQLARVQHVAARAPNRRGAHPPRPDPARWRRWRRSARGRTTSRAASRTAAACPPPAGPASPACR